jgi:hypothetical protein
MPHFQERPHRELDQRFVNPAEHCPNLAIGRFDHFKSLEGPGDRERPDGGKLPEPVIEHDGFGEDAVAAHHSIQGTLKPAHGQRGSVPVSIGEHPCDEPDLPPQIEQ